LKLSLLGRIRFEISKFHVSIQFLGVYGIYTVEPILYKNGTSGTTPLSLRNGPFLRWTDAHLISGTRKAHRLSTLSDRITSCLAARRVSDATDCGARFHSTIGWIWSACFALVVSSKCECGGGRVALPHIPFRFRTTAQSMQECGANRLGACAPHPRQPRGYASFRHLHFQRTLPLNSDDKGKCLSSRVEPG
jgi:hypothetical protein